VTHAPTFLHRHQPWKRQVALAAFLGQIALAVGFWTEMVSVPDPSTEWFLGYLALLAAAAMFIPWIIFRSLGTERVGSYEVMAVSGLVAGWAGTFGLYRAGLGYDTAVHVFCMALFTFVMMDGISRQHGPHHLPVLAAIGFVLAMLAGVGNELFEWAGDRLFGTMMYGEAGQPNDTQIDLVANVVGFVVGAVAAFHVKRV